MSVAAPLHRSSASRHTEVFGSRGRTRTSFPICRRLVVAAIDRQSREVTIEQGSGAAMTDNGQVAVGGLRHDLLDGANNPRLGNDRRLPASDALLGVSKERVGGRLEFLLRKVTRRRSVILAEVVDDAVAVEPKRVR